MQARITLRFIFTLIVGDILAILGAYSLAYIWRMKIITDPVPVSYTHLRAHET